MNMAFTILLCINLAVSPNTGYTYNDSFPLSNLVKITRTIELRKGDQVEGTYQIGGLLGVSYSFTFSIADPKDNMIFVSQDNKDIFNFSANYAGLYTFGFMYIALISNPSLSPEAILSYNIESASLFNIPREIIYILLISAAALTITYLAFKRIKR